MLQHTAGLLTGNGSTRCLRRFLKDAVDELDRRIAAAKPAVRKAKKSAV